MGARTTIEINGFALRVIRMRSGLGIAQCAEEVGISRSYLTRLELGERQHVSPEVFHKLLGVLTLEDRRALLASPHRKERTIGKGPEPHEESGKQVVA